MKIVVPLLLGLMLATPALAEVEQCRFIQGKADREACYTRQEAALAAKRKPEIAPGTAETRTLESLQQMRREEAEVYKSLHSICQGC